MKNLVFLTIIAVLTLCVEFTNSQWNVVGEFPNISINAVDFVNANTGCAAGDNSKVYRTTNGGANWSIFTIPGNPVNLTHAVSKELAYLAGTRSTIYGTTNGGVNWFSTFLGATYNIGELSENNGNLYAAAYINNIALDTIISAAILRSTNNGVNWIQISTIPINAQGDPIHGVDIKLGMKFVSNDTGYIGTVKGIYKTVNAGLNFVLLPNSPPSPKVVVAGSNSLSGTTTFFVGTDKPDKLEIYKSTNGGSTWLLSSAIPDPNGTKQFTGINCPNNTDKIYLTISNSAPGMNSVQDTSIYYSSNGGANWYYQTLPVTNVRINSIDFADGNTGYIAGSNGTILKTTNGGAIAGIQWVSSEIPKTFALYQNYPNPFNPVTNIQFDITSKGAARLTIYDVTGREISVLVNRELHAGTYKIDWNASNYPSGIYFYSIKTGDFTETKKMMLVK